jgi:Ni/Co efflux regulator RcnB
MTGSCNEKRMSCGISISRHYYLASSGWRISMAWRESVASASGWRRLNILAGSRGEKWLKYGNTRPVVASASWRLNAMANNGQMLSRLIGFI